MQVHFFKKVDDSLKYNGNKIFFKYLVKIFKCEFLLLFLTQFCRKALTPYRFNDAQLYTHYTF